MIEDIFIIIIWILLPIGWHYLLKTAGLSLLQVTIPSFVIVFFYFYQYIGFPILYFQLDPYRAQFVSDKFLMIKVFTFTSITITLMIVGYIVANKHLGSLFWRTDVTYVASQNFFVEKIFPGGARQNIGLVILVLISITVLFVYLTKVGYQKIAIIIAMGTENDLRSSARSAMGNSFAGKYHWYKLFMNDFLRFTLFAFFAQYLLNKTIQKRLILFIIFIITTFVMVMQTEKGPMANLIIALFLVYILVKNKGKVPLIKLMFLGGAILSILIVFYLKFMGRETFGEALSGVFSRSFTGQMMPAYLYLEYFTQHHDLLLGRSLPNPRAIFPFEHYELTKEIMAWHSPFSYKKGIVGSMPTVYWGEMYANFGFLGVLIPPFFVGYILYGLNIILSCLQKNPLSIALLVWLLMHLKTLSGTSLSGFLLDSYMVGVIASFALLSFYSGRGVIRYQKRVIQKYLDRVIS